MSELTAHPAACIFPMISEPELSALASDIKENGLLESIVLFDGQILDGRNRYAACKLAGIDPHFTEESPKSPVIYVLSKNMHRRHLTTSQRAAIAAETIPMLAEEAKKRKAEHQFKSNNDRLPPIGGNRVDDKGSSAEIAAKAARVSEKSVERAWAVKKSDPETFEKIKRGEITANAAYEGHKSQPPMGVRDKAAPYVPDTDRKKINAEAQKRKMADGLAMIGGACHGLDHMDVAMAASVCDQEEIEVWATKAETHASELRKFAKRLRGAKA